MSSTRDKRITLVLGELEHRAICDLMASKPNLYSLPLAAAIRALLLQLAAKAGFRTDT